MQAVDDTTPTEGAIFGMFGILSEFESEYDCDAGKCRLDRIKQTIARSSAAARGRTGMSRASTGGCAMSCSRKVL
jgi:hypothetical protein